MHRKQQFCFTSTLIVTLFGCYGGNITDTLDSVDQRDISGIAGPGNLDAARPVGRVARNVYGTENTPEALGFPGLSQEERAFLDENDDEGPLHFFVNDQTPEDGLGPVMNQLSCLGCHENGTHHAASDVANSLGPLTDASTPASRAHRNVLTDYSTISKGNEPDTAAFTLFGDYSMSNGAFNGLQVFGGPVLHVRATGDCDIDRIPSESVDPNLGGNGVVRIVAERQGPPYVGRGLMEAVFAGDVASNEDPDDSEEASSSLAPDPSCDGDCISGRHNENRASNAINGGDPVVRLARFGLRAQGPTLIQFMVGGSQGELGFTSPFQPSEPSNPLNVGKSCDSAADPELTAQQIKDLRTMIRLITIPELHSALLTGDDDGGADEAGVQRDGLHYVVLHPVPELRVGDIDR